MTPINPSQWVTATVRDIVIETPTVKTFVFRMPRRVSHLAGQHYEIRLTAPDGYQAARLYSAASAADGSDALSLTIARQPNGEVTPYLIDHVAIGDQLEVRGPLGKFFTWHPHDMQPLLLVGGGSGIVPLRAIAQTHQLVHAPTPLRLLYSCRTYDDIIYKSEFVPVHANRMSTVTLTDNAPSDWGGRRGVINMQLIQTTLQELGSTPSCYVCGSTPFVEAMTTLLIQAGLPPSHIKAERFGPAATGE